jgi:hypothetical protein
MVYALDPDTLTIREKAEVNSTAVTMALSPDGKTLFVGGRRPFYESERFGGGRKDLPGGTLQSFSTSPLKAGPLVETKAGLVEIVVTTRGEVIATSGRSLIFVDPTSKIEGNVDRMCQGGPIRIHRDQKRVYTGDIEGTPADFRCLSLQRVNGQYEAYDSPYHGEYPLGGSFELSPEGRFDAAKAITDPRSTADGGVRRRQDHRSVGGCRPCPPPRSPKVAL